MDQDLASPRPLASGNTPATRRGTPKTPRRPHSKSKCGCRTCKRRKVKCDEQRPSCGNCIKRAITCDFVVAQNEALSPTHSGRPSLSQPPLYAPNHLTHPIAPMIPDNVQHNGTELNSIDLQLLYNFTTFTYTTLSNDLSFRHMLKTTVIGMGFECPFVMRTVLGLSALHLARFRRDKTDHYTEIGLHHYQVASRLATQQMRHLDCLTREDCEHLHLFAVLTLFFALGSPKDDHISLIMGDSVIPSWLTMLRNAEPILEVLDPKTYRGILSPLFSFGNQRLRVLYGDPQCQDSSLLLDLQTAIKESCADPELLSIYNEVIAYLRIILARLIPGTPNSARQSSGGAFSRPPTPGSSEHQTAPALEAWDIIVWQWHAAKHLIPLLRGSAPKQEAITIYAHFLIMVKKLENQWWLEGWATHMMERIWMCLEDEYKIWIQWPIEELGWVPP